jgi:prepilin-type processing-associated H-X9-DG protein
MQRLHRPKRKGFNRVEVVILLMIVAVLVGIALPVISRMRENHSRDQCADRLRGFFQGCNSYEKHTGFLPADQPDLHRSFLQAIREYMELPTFPTDAPTPAVAQFLCPSRRAVADLGPGEGPSDYGCGSHSLRYRSILAGPEQVTTVFIANRSGTMNTLLVGHLGVRTADYKRGVESGQSSWIQGPLSRNPSQFVLDDDDLPMNDLLGSPHSKASPFLFADGSVLRLPYSPALCEDEWEKYWGYYVRPSFPKPRKYSSK